ncbi:MAG: phospho-sugar mutase [Flavobacteriales bacterium]
MKDAWQARAQVWTESPFDTATREEVARLIKRDPAACEEAFYTDLEFGTGGLRGIMGPGTNRINRYTISMATQGLSNYINENFGAGTSKVAIAYDSRNNSPLFARVAAEVFAANGIGVYLFESLRPTPELSFAIRHLGCQAGVVVTASHNPPEYNGYKVYWDDGGQIVPPHDGNIIDRVRAIKTIDEVKFDGDLSKIELVGSAIDEAYIATLLKQVKDLELIRDHKDLRIVFTSLHGTGITVLPKALREAGFRKVTLVPEQDIPDGNFPTVESPNPEEAAALKLGLRMAERTKADILLGTDPDADRVGAAARDASGAFRLLNGNEAGSLIVYYCLHKLRESGRLRPNHFVAKTIVTTELIAAIAAHFEVPCHDTLTGFKWIASKIRELEGEQEFVAGGEESYGYLIGDAVRDKDAVASAMMLCEIAAWARSQDKTLFDLLEDIHNACGAYRERLISVKKQGKAGKEAIAAMMEGFRTNPPATLGGEKVVAVADVRAGTLTQLADGSTTPLEVPASNVIQFFTEQGSKITARPSGTEPKIKFYFSVNAPVNGDYNALMADLETRIDGLVADFGT